VQQHHGLGTKETAGIEDVIGRSHSVNSYLESRY
jgi:hypothetical protein